VETLESIVSQTYRNWELVIINDGSSDTTEQLVDSYIERGFPITYKYQENKGLGVARNEALKLSKGVFVAFIDHDDLWLPEKLEKQIPCFYGDPETAIVISDVLQFDESGFSSLLYGKRKPKTGHVFKEVFGNNFICLSSAVIRREVLDGLSEWFDPRFKHIEEAELFARIALKHRLAYVDEPLVKNRLHRGSSSYLRPDLSPKETEMMIQKFIDSYPDFADLYRAEIACLRYYVEYYFALWDWRQGKGHMVRKRLRPFLTKRYRAIVPFCFSWFPFPVYDSFLRIYRRRIKQVPMA